MYRYGLLFVLFERYPRAKHLLNRDLPIAFIGYPFVIALACWLDLPGLGFWFELWTPAVNLLSKFLPAFEFPDDSAFGTPVHGVVIRHLLAVGWLAQIPLLVLTLAFVFRTPRSDWSRLTSVWYRSKLLIMAPLALLMFVLIVWFLGIAFGNFYSLRGFFVSLLALGTGFYALPTSFLGLSVALGALLANPNSESDSRRDA